MTTWYKGFTYLPKVEGVFSGEYTQSIREGDKIKVGDHLVWHDWVHRDCGGLIGVDKPEQKCYCHKCGAIGSPYRLGVWVRRLEVEVIEASNVLIESEGYSYQFGGGIYWHDHRADDLAEADGIQPPTGVALGELLNSMYDLSQPKEFQIIRWKVTEKVSKA